jgi:hypothetical protein
MTLEWKTIAACLLILAALIGLGWWLCEFLDEWMGE